MQTPSKFPDVSHAHNAPGIHYGNASARKAEVPVSVITRQGENRNWSGPTDGSHELDDIAPFWRTLEGDITNPIQQCLWSQSCCAALPLDGKLLFVVVKTGSQTGAIAPFVRTKGVLGRLEHLGVKILREPADFVFS